MDAVKIVVNKSSEWCFRESVKMKMLSGFLYMKQDMVTIRRCAIKFFVVVITSMIYIFLCYHRDWEHDNENNE